MRNDVCAADLFSFNLRQLRVCKCHAFDTYHDLQHVTIASRRSAKFRGTSLGFNETSRIPASKQRSHTICNCSHSVDAVAALLDWHLIELRAVSVADNSWQELWTEIQNVAAGAAPDPKWAGRSHLDGLTGGVYVRPTWPQLYHDVNVAAAAAATMRRLAAQQLQAAHADGAKTLTDEWLLSGGGLEWTHAGPVLLRLNSILPRIVPSSVAPVSAPTLSKRLPLFVGPSCLGTATFPAAALMRRNVVAETLHIDLYPTDLSLSGFFLAEKKPGC